MQDIAIFLVAAPHFITADIFSLNANIFQKRE
jgi:hypothetical protein